MLETLHSSDFRIQQSAGRRNRALCLRLQAAGGLLRRAGRRCRTGDDHRLHPGKSSADSGNPRCQARRYRFDRGAVCEGGVRPLRGRCRDGQSLYGQRRADAVFEIRRPWGGGALPDLQSELERIAGAGGRGTENLRTCRDSGPGCLECFRQCDAGAGRHLSGRIGSGAGALPGAALPGAGCRRSGRRW
ncbi:hypothetical protein SDC9_163505 [bioreactor metagenome]|uniref:Uncharacterized protein n=1 Tax=bioreactor metagenome TaxID=1076179 RepID=A0A645FP15_9ZZZZ